MIKNKEKDWWDKQPATAYADGIEVPSFQTCWEKRLEIDRKIYRLKIANVIQSISIIIIAFAVIMITLK